MIQIIIKYGKPIILAVTKSGAVAVSWLWGILTGSNWGTSTPSKLWGFPLPIVSDPDAQAFINAAFISNTTQANAVNTLVIGMKAQSLWTKMKAVYPFVGGTAYSHKFNLKDPRDLNSAFRLSFSGIWTHNSLGAQPNGVTGYADTNILPTSVLNVNSSHISTYITTTPNSGVLLGNNAVSCIMQITGNVFYGSLATTSFSSISQSPNVAFYMVNRQNGTNQKLIRNNTILLSDNKTTTGYSSGQNIYLGSYSSNVYASDARISLSSIGDGLTDTEATNYYNLVQAFQTTLGRQV